MPLTFAGCLLCPWKGDIKMHMKISSWKTPKQIAQEFTELSYILRNLETLYGTEMMIKHSANTSQQHWEINSVQNTGLLACSVGYRVSCIGCKNILGDLCCACFYWAERLNSLDWLMLWNTHTHTNFKNHTDDQYKIFLYYIKVCAYTHTHIFKSTQ